MQISTLEQRTTQTSHSQRMKWHYQKQGQYNLHNRKKNWLTTLPLEAETAINCLPHTDQEYYRGKTAGSLRRLKQQNRTNPNQTEPNIMKQITTKLKNKKCYGNVRKGNSIVILPIQYKQKIQNLINNSFQTTNTNPTKTFQGQIRKTINSTTLIGPDSRWKYKNLNPTKPTIRGLIKLHKTDQPIQPIVNWRNAPAYKLANY